MKVNIMQLVYLSTYITFCSSLNSPEYTHRLAKENYKLVPYFAQRYIKKHNLRKEHVEELMQEGYCGYMKACQKFNSSLGFKISTYSSSWIRKYMDDYIKSLHKQNNLISYNEQLYDLNIYHEVNYNFLDNYNLYEWEKSLLYKRFISKKYFKEIAKEKGVCRDTLRKMYDDIYTKIRNQ